MLAAAAAATTEATTTGWPGSLLPLCAPRRALQPLLELGLPGSWLPYLPSSCSCCSAAPAAHTSQRGVLARMRTSAALAKRLL